MKNLKMGRLTNFSEKSTGFEKKITSQLNLTLNWPAVVFPVSYIYLVTGKTLKTLIFIYLEEL